MSEDNSETNNEINLPNVDLRNTETCTWYVNVSVGDENYEYSCLFYDVYVFHDVNVSSISENQQALARGHKQYAYEIWNWNSKANLSYAPLSSHLIYGCLINPVTWSWDLWGNLPDFWRSSGQVIYHRGHTE